MQGSLDVGSYDFYHRLEHFVKSTGLSHHAFSQSIGLSGSTLPRILREQGAFSAQKVIALLKEYPDLNPRWLLLGESPMLIPNMQNRTLESLEKENLRLRGENEALREVLEVWSERLRHPTKH